MPLWGHIRHAVQESEKYHTNALENRMYGNCYFQCDTHHFYEIEAHWKSATLDPGEVDLWGFLVLFCVFQVTVLNNLLDYVDFLN